MNVLKGKLKLPKNFGYTVKVIFNVWRSRGLPLDPSDIKWVIEYLKLAERLKKGEKITLESEMSEAFSEDELRVVEKLLFNRRSIRQWKRKQVPNSLIMKLLYAGLMTPRGCNFPSIRFLV